MFRIDVKKQILKSSSPFICLQQAIAAVTIASRNLKDAKYFKELLNLILMLGNYMNGSGHNGGAFGFKIASINKVCSVV